MTPKSTAPKKQLTLLSAGARRPLALKTIPYVYIEKEEVTPIATPLRALMRPSSPNLYPASDLTRIALENPPWTGGSIAFVNYFGNETRFRVGGVLSPIAGAPDNTYGWNKINGQTGNGNNVTGFELEFYTDAQKLGLDFFCYGDQDLFVTIDDMPATLKPLHFPNTPGESILNLEFATVRTRKIRVFMGQAAFKFVVLLNPGVVYAAPARPKVAVLTDSFFHGAGGTTEGSVTAMTMAGYLALNSGFEVWNLAQGGTGYCNPGAAGVNSSVYGSSQRLAALAAIPAMDLIIVSGGANDGSYVASTVADAASACWTAIKNARPNTPIVVAGVESGVYPSINTNLDAINNALKARALSLPNTVAGFINMRSPMWVTGTGKINARTGDGNADLFVSSDGVHPSEAGWKHEGGLFAYELGKISVAP